MPRFLSGIPSRPAITNDPGRRARGGEGRIRLRRPRSCSTTRETIRRAREEFSQHLPVAHRIAATGLLAKAKEESDETSVHVTDKGIILLTNGDILQLAPGSSGVPFGHAYFNLSYSGYGAAAAQDTTMVTPEAALSSHFEVNGASTEVMSVAKLTLPDDAEGAHALDYSYSSATSGEQMLESKRIFAYNPSIFARVKD